MSLSDALAHWGWQVNVWLGIGGLSVTVAFACGLTIGRRLGRNETPHTLRQTVEGLKVSVAIWHEKWRAERDLREAAEDREAILRGAEKAYTDAMRRAG